MLVGFSSRLPCSPAHWSYLPVHFADIFVTCDEPIVPPDWGELFHVTTGAERGIVWITVNGVAVDDLSACQQDYSGVAWGYPVGVNYIEAQDADGCYGSGSFIVMPPQQGYIWYFVDMPQVDRGFKDVATIVNWTPLQDPHRSFLLSLTHKTIPLLGRATSPMTRPLSILLVLVMMSLLSSGMILSFIPPHCRPIFR